MPALSRYAATGRSAKHWCDRRVAQGYSASEPALWSVPLSMMTGAIRYFPQGPVRHKTMWAAECPRAARREGSSDWTEHQLSTIGVTEEWYEAVKERFGLAPSCG